MNDGKSLIQEIPVKSNMDKNQKSPGKFPSNFLASHPFQFH